MYSEDMYSDDEEEKETSNKGNNIVKIIICAILVIVIIVLVVLLLKGRNSGGKNTSNSYIVKIIPDTSVTIALGNSYYLSASVTDDNGKILVNPDIRWSVDNEGVASINNGSVKALNYGTTTVTAAYIDSNGKIFQDNKSIVVADGDINTPVSSISFFDGDLYLPVNGTYKIELAIMPPNAYVSQREFNSSDPSVVSVDGEGLIVAHGEGEAVITISVNGGMVTKGFRVVVSNDVDEPTIANYPTDVLIDNSIPKVKVGKSITLKYTVTPADAKTDKLVWTSSNPEVITIDNNGTITALKSGTAIITLSSENNIKNELAITVESDEIEKIEFSQPEVSFDINNQAIMTITVGYPVILKPVITPKDASNPMLNFVQSDPTIVNVIKDPTGTMATIDGLAEGSTQLVVKSSNNIEKTIMITVVKESSNGGSSGGGGSGGATYRCYCNSSGRCQWATGKKEDYVDLQSRIPNSTACSIYSNNHKAACFKDSNGKYKWGNYGNTSGYSYVAGISSLSNCKENTTVTESLTCSATFKGQTGQCTLVTTNSSKIKSYKVTDESVAKVTNQANSKIDFQCINDKTNKQTSTKISVTTTSGKTISQVIVCKPLSTIGMACPPTTPKGTQATCTITGIDSASQLASCSSNKGKVTKTGKTCVVEYDKEGSVTVTATTTLGQSVSKTINYLKGDKTMTISCPTSVTISGSSTTAKCNVTTDAANVRCSAASTGASASYSNGVCTVTYSGTQAKEIIINFTSSETPNYSRTIKFIGKTVKAISVNCPTLAIGTATCSISNPSGATYRVSIAGGASATYNSSSATVKYSGTDTKKMELKFCSTNENVALTVNGDTCLSRFITFNPPNNNGQSH